MPNYHQELLKIIPQIFSQNLMTALFNQMLVSSPKAIIEAYHKINRGTQDKKETPIPPTNKAIFNWVNKTYNLKLTQSVMNDILYALRNSNKILAIKKLRGFRYMSLKEGKDIIESIQHSWDL